MRKLWQHTTTVVTLLLFSVFVMQTTRVTELCQMAMSQHGESCCCAEVCHEAADEITCCDVSSYPAASDVNFELIKQTEAGIALAVISAFRISSAGSNEARFSCLGTSSLSKLSATNPHALLQTFLI
ncbi:MAG: hypothetical protein HGB11_11825 [Chlorobiales bacterium]|nr:hypothetical protein [Chlorobiales bacterium]